MDTESPKGREMLAVGRIDAAHGIRGEVEVDVRTDEPGARFAPGSVLATDPGDAGPLTVTGSRWHGSRLLVRFLESTDRSAAAALRGVLLVVSAAELAPSAEADEFHDQELIGLVVAMPDGCEVGTVTDVVHLPGQDLLEVRLQAGGEALVPFVAAIVHDVDREAGRVVVDPPPGLIDGDAVD